MENLPVVVKKGRGQLEALAKPRCKQRILCPYGKLLAVLDADEVVKVHSFSNANTQCSIDSDRFKSISWISKISKNISPDSSTDAPEQSYLLALSLSNNIHLFQVGHAPFLTGNSNDDSTEPADEESSVALLPYMSVSSMSNKQISSILSKAQLGRDIHTLFILGTSEAGNIVLIANGTGVLHLSIDMSSSPTSRPIMVSSVFTIEPNMSIFDSDLLPQYVSKLTHVQMVWPLLFTLTEDGIVLVYSLLSTVCICAINPIEYCRLFYTQPQDSENILQRLSSSNFTSLAVSPDLMKLSVFTSTHNTILVHLPSYFKHFQDHYPRAMPTKSPLRSSQLKVSIQASKAAAEEEEELLKYGGLTKKQSVLGTAYKGPFVGHFVTQKTRMKLKEKIGDINLASGGHGLNLEGTISLGEERKKTLISTQDSSLKWYEPVIGNDSKKGDYYNDTDRTRPVSSASMLNYTSSFGRRSSATPSVSSAKGHARKPSYVNQTSNWSSYNFKYILPSPDTCSDKRRAASDLATCRLLYADCGNSMVIAYYCNGTDYQPETGFWNTGTSLEHSISYITVYNTIQQTYIVVKLPVVNWLILPTRTDKPVYLVSEKFLSLAAFTLPQEDFVAKVLMYGSAAVAEEVCHLNRWDQCSLPLNALETALELRQLDTVSFFLRNRDAQSESRNGKAPPISRPPPPLPPDQLDSAVDLLTNSIRRNHDSEHNRQFAGQLLGMTLNFLLRLTKSQSVSRSKSLEWTDSKNGGSESLDSSVELLGTMSHQGKTNGTTGSTPPPNLNVTSYIQALRQYIPKSSHTLFGQSKDAEVVQDRRGSGSDDDGFQHVLNRTAIKESWDNKSPRDVIRQALIRGNLPLAHAYLINKSINGGPGLSDDGSHLLQHDVSLDGVISVGLGFIMEALSNRNYEQASSILTQMGANVKESLRFVFLHTVQRQLREFLAKHLHSNGWLTEQESNALDFLHVLESYYPLEDYKQAQTLYQTSQSSVRKLSPPIVQRSESFNQNDSLLSWMDEGSRSGLTLTGNITDHYPEYFGGDQVAIVTMPTLSPDGLQEVSLPPQALYLQVPLYIVLEWDSVARQRILYEGILMSGRVTESSKHMVQPQHKVEYHISHHDPAAVKQQYTDSHTSLEGIVTVDLINSLTGRNQCSLYIRNLFMDDLAREGVYGTLSVDNLNDLLHQMGRVHSLFSSPHPLAISSESGLVVETFHRLFIHYLIEKKFIGLLYLYLDYYKLALDLESISTMGLDSPDLPPWVEYLIHCRLAAHNPSEPSRIFSASLSCSRLLKGSSNVAECLSNGSLLMSLVTMMYAPVSISECTSVINTNKPFYVDQGDLKQALVAFPTLQAAIFPSKSKKLTSAESQDISVYQLLKSGVPFDVSRLFKWQKTNMVAAADDNMEESHEMPHFSQKHLSQKYALTVNLTYHYFLEHGQPSFALANFVASNLVNSSNPSKRIDKAISLVYKMIMSDFTNPKLVSSCIAFIEMLSRDSTPMRIDSLAANRIYTYQQNKECNGTSNGGSNNQSFNDKVLKKKIGSQFIQLYPTPDNHISKALLRRLERATVHAIKSTKIESCSTDAELLWNHVQMFCQCHGLPPSLEFLRECAIQGQWLPLLCHAQLHGVPPKEVLQVVEKNFSNAIAKEHLQLAISTMEMISSPSLANGRSTVDERGKGRNRRRQMGANTLSPAISRPQEKKELTQRDRAKFYSKFGVSTTPSVKEDTVTVSSPQLDIDPMASMHASSVSVIEPVNPNPPISADILPNDFFSVVFHCQDHPHPWQALLAYSIALERPLLALLAGCYDEASLIDCMCVWLCATLGCDIVTKVSSLLNISDEDGDLKFNGSLQWKRWNEEDFAYLLLVAMLITTSQAVSQLPLLFHYFDKENPLYSFMKFREEFIVRFDVAECEQMLKEFSLQLDKCNRLGRNYLGRVGNIQWVEDIVVAFAGHMLVTCPTPFERCQLLKLLVECNFGEGFCCQQINDFHQLHEISSILEKANLSSIPAFKLTGEFNPTFRPAVTKLPSPLELYIVRTRIDGEHVLGVLIEKGQFDAAREYAKVAEVPIAKVTLKEAEFQYQKLADSSYWQYQPARFHFWQKCHKSFMCDKVNPEAAAEFFEYVVQNSARLNPNEKTLLLVLALKWRKDGGLCAAEEEKEQEKQIWLSHINALKEETSEVSQQSLNDLVTDPSISPTFYRHPTQGNPPLPILSALCVTGQKKCTESFKLRQLVLPDDVPITVQKDGKSKLTKQESDVLDKVIGRLVNIGWIKQAQELATLFEHDSTDLTVVLCCIQLASNKLSPDQLTQDILNLLANQPPQRFIGQLHTASNESDGTSGRANDNFTILKMMQQLSERAKNAQNCLYCVMTCLKIANVFHKSFSSVVMSDPFDTLAEILSSKYPDKYALARAFVNSTNMQPIEVAGFLSNCIAASLQSSTGGLPEEDYSRVKVYEPNMTTSQFMSLCALCSDHSRLGQMLLTMAKSYAGTENPSEECLVIQVELLIRSHDCYTLDCSVDGVAEILKVSRDLTNVLFQGKHYKLMVRLLTGVGRFHEMMYIIHLLLECDEFESLVHPKVEKVEQLKVALMEYLRKHSRDSEKMEMVALKFEMYRELAQTREEKGQRELHKLKHKPLASNNFENVKVLKQIYADFRDAAEIYAKDDCMSKSEQCLSQARLVALQLSVLSSGKRVLNLDSKAVQKFMEEQNFIEALVVANAYKKASLAEWVNPLYYQVVINGNTRYLQEFTSVYPLTNSIMQDLASKFLLERSRSPSMSHNMKKILEYCTSLTLKHKISSQLGLQDSSYSENLVNDGFLSDVTKL